MMRFAALLASLNVVSAQTACPSDINSDGAVDVNDLLGVLSDFGGSGDGGSDTNGDGSVDVNDLLGVLSDFGAVCQDGSAGAADPNEEVNCCGGGGSCGYVHCPALGEGEDGCVQPWRMPDGMDFDTDCAGDSAEPAPNCAQGEDCGGQLWNDCGTSCPAICGDAPMMMCNMMCNAAYQCPNGLSWDDVTGECVRAESCTNQFVLPPGMAIGRPFLTVAESAATASPVELLSDWFVEL